MGRLERGLASKWGVLACALSAIGLTGAPAWAEPIDIDNPPSGVFADDWYAVTLDGKKLGHMHSTMAREKGDPGEPDTIRTRTYIELTMGRAGQSVTIKVKQSSRESLDGRPMAFSHEMDAALLGVKSRGTITGGKVTVITRQFGKPIKKTYKFPDGALMSWGAYREQVRQGLEPGTKYEIKLYDASMSPDRALPAEVEILGTEMVDLFGRKVEAIKTKQVITMRSLLVFESKVATTSWVDSDGQVLMTEMNVAGLPVRMVVCAKEYALQPAEEAEFMLQTLVEAGRRIDASRARKIVYRLTHTGGEAMPDVPTTGLQEVTARDGGALTLTVTRRSASETRPADGRNPPTTRPTTDALKKYLEASTYVKIDDPNIKELAAKAAGHEKDPHRLADRLRKFVGDYVRTKNLGVGFATASEVARSREGDCSEHAVLLAALGRANGLPTRAVSGIVYTPWFAGKRDVFVYHMWTQFYLDGEWVDLDAALEQTDVDPTHIALGVTPLGDSGLADAAISLFTVIGQLKIEILSVE